RVLTTHLEGQTATPLPQQSQHAAVWRSRQVWARLPDGGTSLNRFPRRHRRTPGDDMDGRTLAPFLFLLSSAGGCAVIPDTSPEANGKLQDLGWFYVMGRYLMYLGNIDPNVQNEYRFRVEELPPGRDFVLALDLQAQDCQLQRSDLRVDLSVTEENGK